MPMYAKYFMVWQRPQNHGHGAYSVSQNPTRIHWEQKMYTYVKVLYVTHPHDWDTRTTKGEQHQLE